MTAAIDLNAAFLVRLAAARAAMPPIHKTADNPFYSSKYAPLGDILAAVLPVLHAHGLCLYSLGVYTPGGFALAVTVADTLSTGKVESCVPLVGAPDMQKVGAALTYGQRVGIAALLALQIDDDDDGNTASGVGQGRPASAPHRPATAPERPAAASGTTRPAGAPTGQHSDPNACPSCGAVGYIKRVKSGKEAGLWKCFKWPEKNMNGCGARWTYDPNGDGPQAMAARKLPSERVDPAWSGGTAPSWAGRPDDHDRSEGGADPNEPPMPTTDDLPF